MKNLTRLAIIAALVLWTFGTLVGDAYFLLAAYFLGGVAFILNAVYIDNQTWYLRAGSAVFSLCFFSAGWFAIHNPDYKLTVNQNKWIFAIGCGVMALTSLIMLINIRENKNARNS